MKRRGPSSVLDDATRRLGERENCYFGAEVDGMLLRAAVLLRALWQPWYDGWRLASLLDSSDAAVFEVKATAPAPKLRNKFHVSTKRTVLHYIQVVRNSAVCC